MDPIDKPGMEGNQGAGHQTRPAQGRFHHQPRMPAKRRRRRPGDEEGSYHQTRQRIGHPPLQNRREQIRPRHRSGIDQAHHVKRRVDGRTQKTGQSDVSGHIPRALQGVVEIEASPEQEGANDGPHGVAQGRAKRKEAQRHSVHEGKQDRPQGHARPEPVTEQQNRRQRNARRRPYQRRAAG